MPELNSPGCTLVAGANTGVPNCYFAPDKIVGAILIDKNQYIAAADIDGIIATLQALTLASTATRVYPIFRFEALTDNSEDVVIGTLGYGGKQVARDGKYDFTFQITKGGSCLQNRLRQFNTTTKKVLLVDSNNTIIGTVDADGNLWGLSLDFFYAYPVKMADGTNPAMYNVRFALSKPKELNENIGFVLTEVDVEDSVKGLIDLTLTSGAAATLGVAIVKIKTSCDNVDLYTEFSTLLADGALWSVKKDGAVVAISGVTVNATYDGWNVAFTGTGDHVITLAAPSVLAAADVGGYPENGFEAGSITITMPAA